MENLDKQVKILLDSYVEYWSKAKPTELKNIWDSNEREPYYIAEEKLEPIYDWESLISYWKIAEDSLEKFSIRIWNIKYKFLSTDIVAINFMMHWNAIINSSEKNKFALDLRVSSLAKKKNSGLKFFHYTESPLGTLPYIKKIYQDNVDSDF